MDDLNLSDIVERSRLLIEETKQHLAKLDVMSNLGPELAMTTAAPIMADAETAEPEFPAADENPPTGFSE